MKEKEAILRLAELVNRVAHSNVHTMGIQEYNLIGNACADIREAMNTAIIQEGAGMIQKLSIENRTSSTMDITLDDVKQWAEDLKKSKPSERDMQIFLPAHDYPELNDEKFREITSMPGVCFMGGYDSCKRMATRCEKLGIRLLGVENPL